MILHLKKQNGIIYKMPYNMQNDNKPSFLSDNKSYCSQNIYFQCSKSSNGNSSHQLSNTNYFKIYLYC